MKAETKARPEPATDLTIAEPTMSSADFTAWRKAMSLNKTAAARKLGYSPRMVRYWEEGHTEDGRPAPVPVAVALACAALFHRLGPWHADA